MKNQKPLIEWKSLKGRLRVNNLSGAIMIVSIVLIVTIGIVLVN